MLRTTVAISAATLLTAIGMSAPAYAAQVHPSTALSVNSNCSDGPSFVCTATPSGGTPPYTVTFTPVTNATITHHGLYSVAGTCTLGVMSEVDNTVTDSAGGRVFTRVTWLCQRT